MWITQSPVCNPKIPKCIGFVRSVFRESRHVKLNLQPADIFDITESQIASIDYRAHQRDKELGSFGFFFSCHVSIRQKLERHFNVRSLTIKKFQTTQQAFPAFYVEFAGLHTD